VGKAKKIGIIVILVIVMIYLLAVFDGYSKTQGIERTELENMSFQALDKISEDWTYKNLMRNIDDYEGKIIFVQGRVSTSQPDIKSITLCVNSTSVFCDDSIFIYTPQNYLVDDRIEGYVEVLGFAQTQSKEFLGVEMGQETLPSTDAIKIKCTNC
jgi:hypothetical protein